MNVSTEGRLERKRDERLDLFRRHARGFGHDGDARPIEIREDVDRQFAVRVIDSGAGISPDELKRIFRRFYRVPAGVAVRAKGSGLGLFIVRSVARKHGGRAFAESAGPGQGSTFTLLLPAAG